MIRKILRHLKTMGMYLLDKLGLYFFFHACLPKKGITILCYHGLAEDSAKDADVLKVELGNFLAQIQYFKKHFTLISLKKAKTLLAGNQKLDQHYLVITFDDGFKDNYTLGYSIFKAHDLQPAIFLVASNISEQKPLWIQQVDHFLMEYPQKVLVFDALGLKRTFLLETLSQRRAVAEFMKSWIKGYNEDYKKRFLKVLSKKTGLTVPKDKDFLLNWQEVQKLHEMGVEFGSHTLTHPTLSKIGPRLLRKEIRQSKRIIENNLHSPVYAFAYPYGKKEHYNQRVKEALKSNYSMALTTRSGMNGLGHDLLELRRIVMDNSPLYVIKFRILKAKLKFLLER